MEKVTKCLCLLTFGLAIVSAAPGDSGKEDGQRTPGLPAELKPQNRDLEFFYGPVAPFDLLKGFNDMFEQMRQQMVAMMALVPNRGGFQQGDSNASSVTKVIDGHKYIVNETVYSGGDGDAGAMFRVRVLDIRPAEQATVTSSHEVSRDDSIENDVNRLPTAPQKRQAYEYLETMDEPGSSMGIIDLSNDIYVNELAANQGRPQNPDAELIHLPESRPWQSNLEHDLRVNQLAAEQGWTPHPDSEFIDAKNEALSHSRPHVVQFADGRMRQSRSRYEYRTWP